MSRDLMQAADLRSVLDLVGPVVTELLEPDEALLLVDLESQEYVTAFDPSGHVQPADRGGALYMRTCDAKAARQARTVPDVAASQADTSQGGGEDGRGRRISVAFFPPEQPIGALSVHWHDAGDKQQLGERETLLRYLTELAGAAIGNVVSKLVLEEKVAVGVEEAEAASHEHASELRRRDMVEREKDRVAVTDVLTGLLNRRGFFLHAEQSFKLARRQGVASAVVFADIDGLKAVNDALGHEVGDRLLRSGGEIFGDSFRDSDVIARIGGDEFVAFTLDSAHTDVILARIRENVESFHRRTATPYRLSFSIGIVQCDPTSDMSLADYLALADKQMYERKRLRSAGPS